MSMNEAKLHEFVGKMLGDMGAAATGALVMIGDKLGLYRAIAEEGRVTPEQLAEKTGTSGRYVREWLSNQAASGYVEYDPGTEKFFMTPEQVAVFAEDDSPFLMTGGFHSVASLFRDEPLLTEAFRTGRGVGWGEHDASLFSGVAKFFKPSYKAHLIESWIPSLEGVREKLDRGATVADVGCGHGISTMIMAETFPKSRFAGFDYHVASIEHAREMAKKAKLENVTFDVATASDYPGEGYELVTMFDCLHDMGDPTGAAAHVRKTLASDGTWMVVEPFAGDSLQENLNPVGRLYYAFSTLVCTPNSLSQEVGAALGAQAGEARLQKMITGGGFSRFRRATETPFNLVLEARP
jgi:SAM-dependent methyltransferase